MPRLKVTLAGVDCPDALSAIGSVMPIDLFVDEPLRNMCPSPGLELPPAGVEVRARFRRRNF